MSALAAALLSAQKAMPPLEKKGKSNYGKFVRLDDLVETALPILNGEGLLVMQFPTHVDGQPALTTRIIHAESGESFEDTMLLMMAKADPQGQGSAITYARRYAFAAALSLVADEDDDGAKATQTKRESRRRGVERVPDPGLPTAPVVSDDSADRIIELGSRLKGLIGEAAARAAYVEARDAVAEPGSTLLEAHAVSIIAALEKRLEDSADTPPADSVTVVAPGSDGPPTPVAPPITKKQRDTLKTRQEQLFNFTGNDEAWYEIMAGLGAKTVDDLDNVSARQAEHLANESLKKTEFVVPAAVQQKLAAS